MTRGLTYDSLMFLKSDYQNATQLSNARSAFALVKRNLVCDRQQPKVKLAKGRYSDMNIGSDNTIMASRRDKQKEIQVIIPLFLKILAPTTTLLTCYYKKMLSQHMHSLHSLASLKFLGKLGVVEVLLVLVMSSHILSFSERY